MTEKLYVVTADIMDQEPDGVSHEDGSRVFRTYVTKRTWAFPASTPIGDIMEEVEIGNGYVMNITITQDRVSAKKIAEEERAASKAKHPDVEL
jgi:hypothetical protein